MQVTACIPTRGDHDLTPILDSLPKHWGRIVWDNSQREVDAAVYGRYLAINEAPTTVIYTQDDDCVLAPESLDWIERRFMPGVITANMPMEFRPHYPDSCLIGFGAIFEKRLPARAFARVGGDLPESFPRTCDVYFTALTPGWRLLDLPYENLPWATAPERMYRQPTHVGERAAALGHARLFRD